MESFSNFVDFLNGIAWGPWMLILLVGTGILLSVRMGFIQFSRFGYAMKNTLGKVFKKQQAGHGEVTLLDVGLRPVRHGDQVLRGGPRSPLPRAQ